MFTVLGATGFVGSHLAKRLKAQGAECLSPGRAEDLVGRHLGHVVYCIGVTADFRTKPFETVNAHVCQLWRVLKECEFDSLLYLSSTRVYGRREGEAREGDALPVKPFDADELYNISKLMGEALVLSGGQRMRVARLSNVYGADFTSANFLATVIHDALSTGRIRLRTALDTAKDYVSIDAVVGGLIRIATSGRQQIYNLASGVNCTNWALVEKISALTGCQVEVAPDAERVVYPRINVERVQREFNLRPVNVLNELDGLIALYRNWQGTKP